MMTGYRLTRILGNRLRVETYQGKPVAMYDPVAGKEYRWQDNRWQKSPIQAKDKAEFGRRYGFRFMFL